MKRLISFICLIVMACSLNAQYSDLYNPGSGFTPTGDGPYGSKRYRGTTPSGETWNKTINVFVDEERNNQMTLSIYDILGNTFEDMIVVTSSSFSDGSFLTLGAKYSTVSDAYSTSELRLEHITMASCLSAILRKNWVHNIYILEQGGALLYMNFKSKHSKEAVKVHLVKVGNNFEIRRNEDNVLLKTIK